MAKLPQTKRLVTEDFTEQKSWIGKLFQPLNAFMEAVYSALNRSLTLKENLAADIRTVDLDASSPALKLAWTLRARPVAVLVGDVTRTDGGTATVSAAVFVRWSFTQAGELQIDQVFGVSPTPSARYRLTLVIFTG